MIRLWVGFRATRFTGGLFYWSLLARRCHWESRFLRRCRYNGDGAEAQWFVGESLERILEMPRQAVPASVFGCRLMSQEIAFQRRWNSDRVYCTARWHQPAVNRRFGWMACE